MSKLDQIREQREAAAKARETQEKQRVVCEKCGKSKPPPRSAGQGATCDDCWDAAAPAPAAFGAPTKRQPIKKQKIAQRAKR